MLHGARQSAGHRNAGTEGLPMTRIVALTTRSHTRQPLPAPVEKPVMTWVIDPATGRPVMAWSLPNAEPKAIAA
jgi:hypothetical protein